MNYNQFSNPSGGYNSDNPKSDGYGGIITPPADKTSVAPFNIPIPRSSKRDVFDFWPSQNGLKYSNNDWPTDVPYFSIPVTLFGISFVIPVGHASDGMCGGMAYAVRDLYEAGILPPTSRMNPIPNSPAWNFLYARLVQSFNIPLGILKYITWMDYKRHAVAVGANGVSWMTIMEAMPILRTTIDSGHLCPLGLVFAEISVSDTDSVSKLISAITSKIGQNHQVLAWGYSIDGPVTTVKLCDSNHPNDNTITIEFDHTKPEQSTVFKHSKKSDTLYGFFTTDYSPENPAPMFKQT